MDQILWKPPSTSADTPSDEQVGQRVLDGDVELFELLMRRNNQRVYRAVRGLLRDEAEVEDVMQQAYLSAYQNLAQFRGSSRFSTWLVRIALNEALIRIRHTKKLVALDGGMAQEDAVVSEQRRAASPEDLASQHELLGLLESSIDALPNIYRMTFMLREVEGLSTAESADALDTTEEVVKTRLHRAKVMLKERLSAVMQDRTRGAFAFHAPRCDRVVSWTMERIMSR